MFSMLSKFYIFSMSSMFHKLTLCSPMWNGRIPQFVKPCWQMECTTDTGKNCQQYKITVSHHCHQKELHHPTFAVSFKIQPIFINYLCVCWLDFMGCFWWMPYTAWEPHYLLFIAIFPSSLYQQIKIWLF